MQVRRRAEFPAAGPFELPIWARSRSPEFQSHWLELINGAIEPLNRGARATHLCARRRAPARNGRVPAGQTAPAMILGRAIDTRARELEAQIGLVARVERTRPTRWLHCIESSRSLHLIINSTPLAPIARARPGAGTGGEGVAAARTSTRDELIKETEQTRPLIQRPQSRILSDYGRGLWSAPVARSARHQKWAGRATSAQISADTDGSQCWRL